MVATSWLTLRTWHEPDGAPGDASGADSELAVTYLRPAALLWLATLGDAEWVALDDLAGHLTRGPGMGSIDPVRPAGRRGIGRQRAARDARHDDAPRPTPTAPPRGRARPGAGTAPRGRSGAGVDSSGRAAYPLGLVRAAEELGTGRRVVQLTPLGRYVLASGPTPPPRPTFDQFLFVQPELRDDRLSTGADAHLVGRLSRFAQWSQVGSALELKLTHESIVFGLEGGLNPDSMLETLARHSQRAMPAGVVDASGTGPPVASA